MSDSVDEQRAADARLAESSGEPLAAWGAHASEPRWEEIADGAELAGPGPAGPGPAPERSASGSPASGGARVVDRPATSERTRRPSSLRSSAPPPAERSARPAGRPSRPADPVDPSPPAEPAERMTAERQAAVSEQPSEGMPRKMPNPVTPLIDKLPIENLRTIVKERPEVGLGLAFASGLVIATLLRRLAR